MKRALCLALCLAGCAPSISFLRTGDGRPRAGVDPATVRVLYAGDPLPPLTEVGYLEANQTVSFHSADDTGFLGGLAEEAAARGCDAIVLHDGCTRTSWSRRHGPYDFARLSATCAVLSPVASR